MPEIAAAIVGITSLILVGFMALTLLKMGMAPSEMTDTSRQRLIGCGFGMLALGLLGCIIAFGIMVGRLTKGL